MNSDVVEQNDLKQIYFHQIIHAIAISLISIFIPVFLLKLGFSLSQVFTYIFVQWSTFAFGNLLSVKMMSKFGAKNTIILKAPFYIVTLVLLSFLGAGTIPLWSYIFIAILAGLSESFQILPIQTIFSESIQDKKSGNNTGMLFGFQTAGSIIGPFIGGYLVELISFNIIFGIVGFGILLSVIPLFWAKRQLNEREFKPSNILILAKTHKLLVLRMFFYGIILTSFYLILPVAIYLVNRDSSSLGMTWSFVAIVQVIVTILIGKFSDRIDKIKILKIGSAACAVILVLLWWFIGDSMLFPLSIVSSFCSMIYLLPLETMIFEAAKKSGQIMSFLMLKEFTLYTGRILVFVPLIVFAKYYGFNFLISSVAAIFTVIF